MVYRCLYHLFLVIWGMVYYCFNHIIPVYMDWDGFTLQIRPSFDQVSLVFIYDFPDDIETYIHRVGRTGRNGRPGRAVSLFVPQYWNSCSPQTDEIVDIPGVESGSSMSIPIAQVSNHWTRNGFTHFHPKTTGSGLWRGFVGEGVIQADLSLSLSPPMPVSRLWVVYNLGILRWLSSCQEYSELTSNTNWFTDGLSWSLEPWRYFWILLLWRSASISLYVYYKIL